MSLRDLNDSNDRFLDIQYDGVLAEDVPTIGEHGGSVLANDLQMPADAGTRVRAKVVTLPAEGNLQMQMDGSFVYSGGTGHNSFTYQPASEGVDVGSPMTVDIYNGGWSFPSGIAPTTYFGVPTHSLSSFPQTSYPDGIAPTTAFGVPSAYLSGGLQVSYPDGIAPTTAFGVPTHSFSGTHWREVEDQTTIWTEI